ncbi:hypothetical protein K474DRAFT_568614 [Panus rudis PR-1116 ss-1]|nr:hypothetical protein K474DRAFT_568614 [Panus rudis PR-1116 ss-1]
MPLGIITLEDVLEELIGEEIYDEFDPEGRSHLKYYNPVNGRKAVRPKTFGGSNVDGLPAPAKADSEPHHGNAASTPQSPVSISATPASPTISEDQPHSRAESLANSLGALVFRRRDRSGQRQGPGKHSASDTDLVMLKRRKVAEEPAIAVSPTKELQEEDDRDDATHSGERNNEAR